MASKGKDGLTNGRKGESMTKVHTFKKEDMVSLLIKNNETQPKAKYSNDILLAMLEHVSDNFTARLEETRGNFAFNRGSAVECLLRAIVTGEMNAVKAQAGEADLFLKKAVLGLPARAKIEVKFSTSFAPATAKTSKGKWVVIIGQEGAFLVESKNLVATAKGKINLNDQNAKYCHRLNELSEALGL